MPGKIWVVLQHRDGRLHRMSREAIAAGQALSAKTGGAVEAILLGEAIGELAQQVASSYNLAAVRTVDDPRLGAYSPGAYCGAIGSAMEKEAPAFVVLPHTYQSVDFMARLAQSVEAALVPEVIEILGDGEQLEWKRPVLGGKLHARVRTKGEGPVMISIQSGVFSADSAAAGQSGVEPLPADADRIVVDREILRVEEAASDQVDLSAAEIIVGVGRGVGGADKLEPVEELARALGAEIGASRPVIDSDWLPRERQIGSSGQTVAPKLYLALGISGAIQHLVGMKGSQVIVAVNKDASAPIFNIAQYGVVGDLHEIVPALTAAVKEAREV
jgi:electron transfer flavoprotein alpha subunit